MRKILPIFLWFPTTIGALLVSLMFLVLISKDTHQTGTVIAQEPILSIPAVLGSYHSNIIARDARPEIVAQFLESYSCPLQPYEQYALSFVNTADKYNLDFRLLPAIAMQESNCCKKMPDGSNNCWGYGIYGDQTVHFSSVEEGMDIVGQTLAKNYTTKGLMEPDEIMGKYTPQSKGSWAYGVLYFMNEMK
ncbi:MAG: hypothetical protein UU81_C0019G0002 [Microgenomates group bacterium GW2011_GWC1_41_8]|uniref:Uncharacterized protein n=2 Tax=Candidatus Roizmaniibacteriota TaxID=1752723 RepID=A0A0G1ABR2_9BACT|nr:MAG: hypothetical protein UU41_C0026G0021 [Candidatus Roizmanbacteria bacterium GW2011_GWA1_41_13]KKS22678.1 MAG: hypothetical protein UU78_C0013G0004 [Candidatus Roizmanbacteria bacterium GW2011_GWC2_41_7]KKS23764.1 MAG: hypothetical protein UU81_C0019G0002 [Microgenomates group bacterium GW2011_GWC1_41_8]